MGWEADRTGRCTQVLSLPYSAKGEKSTEYSNPAALAHVIVLSSLCRFSGNVHFGRFSFCKSSLMSAAARTTSSMCPPYSWFVTSGAEHREPRKEYSGNHINGRIQPGKTLSQGERERRAPKNAPMVLRPRFWAQGSRTAVTSSTKPFLLRLVGDGNHPERAWGGMEGVSPSTR